MRCHYSTKQGYRGPVFSTAPADLAELILKDFASLEAEFARLANRMGFSKHAPALPLYGMRDVVGALRCIKAVPMRKWVDMGVGHDSVSLRTAIFWARHLWSWIIEAGELFFSGDIGRPGSLLMHPPSRITRLTCL